MVCHISTHYFHNFHSIFPRIFHEYFVGIFTLWVKQLCFIWGENADLNLHVWFSSFFFLLLLLCAVWVISGLLATLVYRYLIKLQKSAQV